MPQGKKKSAVEIFETEQRPARRRSAVDIFEQEQVAAPSAPTPAGPAPGFLENLATGAKQGFVDYIANPALAASEALASLTTGNVEPARQLLELVGRGVFQTLTEPLVKDQPSISDQSQQIAAIQAEQAKRRATIPTFQTARTVSQELEQRAAADPSLGGKITRGVAAGAVGAVPVVGAGLLSGGSIPAMAATAAAQSAAQPENLGLNVALAVTPLPLGKLVAPILRRIRGVKAAPEIPGITPETPPPSPSLAKAIGQDAFDDTKIAVEELGLARVPQPTRPNGAVPVQREIPVESITLSRDTLSRGRMYQAEQGLKQGVKREGETFTTLGGKQRIVEPIQVLPDPQNPGRFIVEGDGNHRVALLQLQGSKQLIPVKSFETPAQSGAVEEATAAVLENYYRPQMALPALEEAAVEPFGVSLGKERAPKPGAVGPRIDEYGFVEGSTTSPGVVTAAERTPILKTIVALIKAGWLSRPNTHMRNLGYNAGFALSEEAARVPAAIADMVVSPIFGGGRRTITGPSAGAMARSLKEAVTKGLSDAKQVIKNGITDADAERLALQELNSPSKVLNAWVNYNFRLLSAEDKVFHALAARRALEDRARSIALTESHAGEIARGQIGERTRELIANPPESLAAAVAADAEIAVFQNENLLSGYLRKGREFLEGTGTRKGRLASAGTEMVLPFPKTPTNVIGKMLEYAGGGYIKNIGQVAKAIANKGMTEAEQRAFSQSFGRASVGVPLIVLGGILYKKGLMTGYVEDDPKRKARDEAAGRVPGSILIGDTWHQVVGSSPFGNLMTIGATITRENDQERDDALKAYTEAVTRFVGEQPLMMGAKQLTAPLNQPGTFTSRTVGGFVSGMVPGIVSDVAQTFDSTRRQSDTIYRQVAGRIPGLRNTLPERPDVLGRSVPLPFPVDPTKSTTAQEVTNPLMAELVRLDQGISGFEKRKTESDEEYAEKVNTFGQLYGQYGLSLINSPSYQNQNDVAKQEIFDLFNQRLKTLITENQERFAQAKLSPPALLQAFRESQLRKLQKRNK